MTGDAGDGSTARPRSVTSALGWSLYLLGCLCWALFDLAYPNVFGGTDVFHFKDPACNLAAGHGLVSASFVGSESFDELLWFSQGPLFPLLYGAYASFAGCGLVADNAFDLSVSIVLGGLVLGLLRRALDPLAWILLTLGLAFMVPTGGFNWPSDRPDHLALCFVLLVPLFTATYRGQQICPLCAYFVAGLAFATSPYYGLLALLLAAILVFECKRPLYREAFGQTLAGLSVFLAAPAVTVVAFLIADPETIDRFVHHTRIVLSTDLSFLDKLNHAVNSSGYYARSLVLKWLAALLIVAFVLFASLRHRSHARLPLVPLALLLILVVTPIAFTRQNNYYAAAAFVSIILVLRSIDDTRLFSNAWRRIFGFLCVCLLLLPLAPFLFTNVLQRLQSYDSFEEQSARAANARRADQDGVLLLPATHYFLYKPTNRRVFNFDYLSDLHDRSLIDAALVCRTVRPLNEPFPPSNVRLPESLSPAEVPGPTPMQVAGRTIMSRDWGWGCIEVPGYPVEK